MMFKRKTLFTAIVLLASFESSFCQTNTFPSSGNVGIGTTSPTYSLDVHGSLRDYYDTATFESSSNGRTIFIKPGGFAIDFSDPNGAIGMINRYVSTNLIVNAGGGNFMVGYPAGTSTSYKADVDGNTRVAGNLTTTGTAIIGQTGTPNNLVQITATKGQGIDIGKGWDDFNYPATCPLGSDIGSYSIRFYTWRDEVPNQIGAKISAIRINNYQNNNPLIQATDIAFYTSNGIGTSGSNLEDNTVEDMRLTFNGNLLIGKTTQTNTSYKLDVNGNIRANKLVVNTTGADYVFDPGYHLSSLDSLNNYIKANHHLPGIEPAKQMQQQGMDVGENQKELLQKVEELTLYLIELNKRMDQKDRQIEELQREIIHLKKTLRS
jgi:hypothetical protein